MTMGSAFVWGLAHIWVGRRLSGLLLLGIELILAAGVATAALTAGPALLALAVQPVWLWAFALATLLLATATVAVVIRSYLLVRPESLSAPARLLSAVAIGVLCVLVVAPMAYAARLAYISQTVVTSVFARSVTPIPVSDPWNGRERINILLIGADAAANRIGIRTDSMTVASVDTRTGDTVLFGLPRNLEDVPMPPGPARERFPDGFQGEPPYSPGLLNEVYQYAEDHPETVPRASKGHRGPTLLKKTVSGILGIEVTNYAMVDMWGFVEIIDAMGGVRVHIREPIVYGRQNEGLIEAGRRRLSGEEALWYGRSRTFSDDYVRMGRQKCLMNAVAKQADPVTVLRSFERLADAAVNAVSTDIPRELLPDLVELAGKVKDAEIRSLQFVPPLINTGYPDYDLIRREVTAALTRPPTRPSPSAPLVARPSGRPDKETKVTGGVAGARAGVSAVTLDAACG
ncbi:LCP family protein required for cell wall assembly [Streptosporangium becharense]|uniref:LCP family protein required for cell wall assembly n=2 Tax=Streptosporangium becharense TaxID=1816182 RepID=A0A7W9IGW2_9ACTN|nr:LCP family protein required for cell wall assembly [Streptosporangium becharense]